MRISRFVSRPVFLAAALALGPAALRAQLPRDASPTQVAQAALDALADRRWPELVALVDPAQVDSFRARYLRNVENVARSRALSGPMSTAAYSDNVPQCVAEWRKQQHRQQESEMFPGTDEHVPVILEVADLEAARALPAATVLERYLRNNEPRRLDSLAVRFRGRGGAFPRPDAEARYTTLGAIVENESLAHVAYRPVGGEVPVFNHAGLLMMTLRRTDQGWRVSRAEFLHANTRSVGLTTNSVIVSGS